MCIHVCSCSFKRLTCTPIVSQLTHQVRQQHKRAKHWKNKFIRYLCFIVVDFLHSCHRRLKMSSFRVKKNKFQSIDLTCWQSPQPLCLRFWRPWLWVLWKFSILWNILDLEWCLLNKWKLDSASLSQLLRGEDKVTWPAFQPVRMCNSYIHLWKLYCLITDKRPWTLRILSKKSGIL